MNNVDIDYNQYLNDARIAQKNEMVQNAINEIKEEKSIYVRDDLNLLNIIAESVEVIEKEKI